MTTETASLRPSPSMDVLSLVHALGRAEWGPLAGEEMRGARLVLDALASIMWDQHHGRSATTLATARQIADRAAYSVRWTRTSLHRLEDAGLVQWQRGGVIDGNPQPGRFRIIKSVLCDWIEAARRRHDERMRRYIEETRRRLRALIYKTVRPRLRSSSHAEASSNLPPYRGRKGATRSAHSAPKSPTPPRKDTTTVSTLTLDLKAMQTLPPEEFMPLVCVHSMIDIGPGSCNACRSKAWQDYQAHQRREREEAARKRAEQRTREEADEEAKGSAFAEYMRATYPDKRRSEWSDLILIDEEAARLANA